MKRFFVLIALCFFFQNYAQIGGLTGFNQLNYHYSARQLGHGSDVIAVLDKDMSTVWNNPALLNPEMFKQIFLSNTLQGAGINAGALAWGKSFGKINGLAHFRYLSYGKMKRTDEAGTDIGTFTPGDFILGASASKNINERMFIGATCNLIYSQLDNYIAFGSSVDLGGVYHDPEKRITVAGTVKNLGVQFKSFTKNNRSPLPLEVQAALSHKLAHAPFRFTLLAHNLQKFDLTYVDPNEKDKIDPLTGDTVFVKRPNFMEKTARHLAIQTELLFGKKVSFRFGFDYHRRKELQLVARPALAGFSFGAGLQLKRFTLDYGWLIYSSAGGQHGLSLTIPVKF